MSDAVEISFEKLFRFLWRWGLVALLASVATACFVYLWISREAPTYYAEAVNFIDRSGVITNVTDLPEYTFAPLNVTAYRVAARSDAVLAGALESLGLSTTPADIEGLRRSITLSSDEQPGLLYVGVAAGSPSEAAEIANAIAARLVAWDSERAKAELDRIIEEVRQTEFTDPHNLELGHEFVKLMVDEMPIIPVMSFNVFSAYDTTYWTGFPTAEDNPYANIVTNWANSKYILTQLKPTGN